MRGPLRDRLTRLADLVRTVGPRRSLTVLPVWLLLRREFVVVVTPIPALPEVAPARAGMGCTVLDEAGLRAFVARCPEMTEREIRLRWSVGIECKVLWHEGAIVAYRWDVTGAVGAFHLPYLGRAVRLDPGDALVYDTRTLPASRRLRLGAELVAAAVEHARRRGARRYLGLIATWNRASLQWAELLGWERLGTVGWRRVGLRRRYFATGVMAIVDGEIRFPPRSAPPGGLSLEAPTS